MIYQMLYHKVNACIIYTPTKTSIIWLKTRISHNTLSGCCRQSETVFVFGRAGPSWIPSTESSGWVRHHSPDWSRSSIALGHYCLRVSIAGSRCLWKTPIRWEKREQSQNLLIKNIFSTLANSYSIVIKCSHKVGCESLSLSLSYLPSSKATASDSELSSDIQRSEMDQQIRLLFK